MDSAKPRVRIFAGDRLRALRLRLGLSQTVMCRQLGISVSYLSQIENNQRPMTDAVLITMVEAFPGDWELGTDDAMALLAAVAVAVNDFAPGAPGFAADALRRAVNQQPDLARHFVAAHAAYRRSQEQLASLDDALDSGSAKPLPWEEARDWFQSESNYVADIDRGAECIADRLEHGEAAILDRLRSLHGVSIWTTGTGEAQSLRRFDPATRQLTLDPALSPSSRLFLLAVQLARLELDDVIESVARAARLSSQTSRDLVSIGLANYAAGALLMPYSVFREAARKLRHDVDALGVQFHVSFEQACHRLSTLQRPGLRGTPFFFCRVDMAGNITKRHSATPLRFARYGGACPLWMVHEAVAIPDRTVVQLSETPDGVRYVTMAKGLVKPSGTHTRPSRRYAVALGCEVRHAAQFIYGDQLDLAGIRSATLIGISCRTCPRHDCDQRAFPPAGRAIVVDRNARGVVPYEIAN